MTAIVLSDPILHFGKPFTIATIERAAAITQPFQTPVFSRPRYQDPRELHSFPPAQRSLVPLIQYPKIRSIHLDQEHLLSRDTTFENTNMQAHITHLVKYEGTTYQDNSLVPEPFEVP